MPRVCLSWSVLPQYSGRGHEGLPGRNAPNSVPQLDTNRVSRGYLARSPSMICLLLWILVVNPAELPLKNAVVGLTRKPAGQDQIRARARVLRNTVWSGSHHRRSHRTYNQCQRPRRIGASILSHHRNLILARRSEHIRRNCNPHKRRADKCRWRRDCSPSGRRNEYRVGREKIRANQINISAEPNLGKPWKDRASSA